MIQVLDQRAVMDTVAFKDLEVGQPFITTNHNIECVCVKILSDEASMDNGVSYPNIYNFTQNIVMEYMGCECVTPVKAKLCVFGIHEEV